MACSQLHDRRTTSSLGNRLGVSIMKVGDLVRARHWTNGEVAILLSFRIRQGAAGQANHRICRVAIGDYVFDQLVSDLEVL